MNSSSTQEKNSMVKIAFIIVLPLIVLPLAILLLVQFAPPVKTAPSAESVTAGEADAQDSAVREHRAKRTEARTARQEAKTADAASVPHGMAPDPDMAEFDTPDDISVVGVGAVVPDAPRGKKATPYPPGEGPGDSGVIVQYAGSPDDMIDAPSPPPQDDLWGGRPVTPINPANMRGIGGVRRIDPNDPFFQQDIPNPFNNP